MHVTIPLGMRHRVRIGHSPRLGWWTVRWRRPAGTGWEGWNLGWDDDGSPGAGVREPRRPPPSPLQGAAELPEPD